MTALQSEIEERLAVGEPAVDVLLAEVVGGRTLRVFIDHPEGVSLQLCERVAALLGELRERYSLEVSSPGPERPLTKPAHFRKFVGQRVRVRVRLPRHTFDTAVDHAQARAGGSATPGEYADRRSFTGELLRASDSEITLVAERGVIAIPYSEIRRSNLLEA